MDALILVLGVVIADLCIARVLWKGCSPARGWCRDCAAPDLWAVHVFTRSSKVYGVVASVLAFVGLAFAATAGQRGTPPQILLATSATLLMAALMFAVKSRSERRRLLCCRACGRNYDLTIRQRRVGS